MEADIPGNFVSICQMLTKFLGTPSERCRGKINSPYEGICQHGMFWYEGIWQHGMFW